MRSRTSASALSQLQKRAVRCGRARIVVLFSLCMIASSWRAATVLAHSQPGVSGILDDNAGGVQVVRLYQGIVRRDGSSWRFVCTRSYGGADPDSTAAGPQSGLAGSLPGGGVAIALPMGIAVMKRDGSTMPHPDPIAEQGKLTAFARTPDKLYALRWREQFLASDVVEITESSVRVLYTDTQHWNDIGVTDSSLVLMRFGSDEIDEMRLSFAGEMLSLDNAPLPNAIAVSMQVMGDIAYHAARFDDHSILGRIIQGQWSPVLMAGNMIGGPLALQDGTALVALDGVLSTFANDVATPLGEPDFVSGLFQLDDRPYACTRTGLRDLTSTGLGAQLFDMSEMVAPDECSLSPDDRSACELEWQHVFIEVLGANIPVKMDDAQKKVCAAAITGATAAAGSGGSLSGAAGAAGTSSNAASTASNGAGATGSPETASPIKTPSSGCACNVATRSRPVAFKLGSMLVAFCLIRLASRRVRGANVGGMQVRPD